MDSDQPALRQLVLNCASVKRLCHHVRQGRFPNKTPNTLAAIIETIVCSIEKAFLKSRPSDAEGRKLSRGHIGFALETIQTLGQDLRYVHRASLDQIPWGIVGSLEKLALSIYPQAEFIFRCLWKYSYSIMDVRRVYVERYSQLLDDEDTIEGIFDRCLKGKETIYIVGFPRLEEESAVMHVLLAHELGHPIERKFFEQDKPDNKGILERVKLKGLDETPKLKLFERVTQIRDRAVSELICDITAVRVFGPAALFAMYQYSMAKDLDAVSYMATATHYPPHRYRLRVMLEELPDEWLGEFCAKSHFGKHNTDAFGEAIEHIKLVTQEKTDLRGIASDDAGSIAYEYVERTLPAVREFIQNNIDIAFRGRDHLIHPENGQLLHRLIDKIPPDSTVRDGIMSSASLPRILNIGWIYILGYEKSEGDIFDPETLKKYLFDWEVSQKLLIKGIEYGKLIEDWRASEHTVQT